MNSPIVSVALVALGAVFGLMSALFTSTAQQRNSVTLKLLDGYLEVRKAIVDAVSNLTNLDLREALEVHTRDQHRDNVAKLFYMHYDFLPKTVLDSLILLQMCLDSPEDGLLGIENDAVVPLSESGTIEFVERCSLFENAALVAAMALKSGDATTRANQAIRLHARNVLYTLNSFSSTEDLLMLAKRFKKLTRAQRPLIRKQQHHR